MGLDMRLYRKTYVKNYEGDKPEEKVTIEITGEKATHIDTSKIAYITEDVMYWRKANQIHNWFVQSCNDGNDNNGSMDVSREQLQELLDTCSKVLAGSKLVKGKITNGYSFKGDKEIPILEDGEFIEDSTVAETLLPVVEGFFFGSQNYDQYYLQDVKETKDCLERLLSETTDEWGIDYEYSASW